MNKKKSFLLGATLIIGLNYNALASNEDPIPAGYQKAMGVGGNEKTGKYVYGQDYDYLIINDQCELASPYVITKNMNNNKTGGAIHKADCSKSIAFSYDQEVNGGYAAVNDAHYFANNAVDMFKNWANYTLKDKITVNVHYGNNYENLFFDGLSINAGDGNRKFYPLVSADIMAHEISHKFTQNYSNLKFHKQSGAINESFGDISGIAAKAYLNRNNPDYVENWMTGDTIMKGDKDGFRYLDDPSKDGRSINSALFYHDGMDIQGSSGIFNRAFYLLATTPDWNVRKAFEVFAAANRYHWQANETFDSAACGVYKATLVKGYNVEDVVEAFRGVDVKATCKK